MDDIITHGDLNKCQGCCELSAEEIIRALKELYARQPYRRGGSLNHPHRWKLMFSREPSTPGKEHARPPRRR